MRKIDLEQERMLFANDLEEFKMSEQGNILRIQLSYDRVDTDALGKAIDQYYGTRDTDMMVWVNGNREKGIEKDNAMIAFLRRQREYGGY